MNRTRRRRAGFTLTEVLMALGILGVGLSMIASVFPVAVDQSRRSRDSTMAALSARSAAAMMRARRDKVLAACRQLAKNRTAEIQNDAATVPLKSYHPTNFLYGDTAMVRKYGATLNDLWTGGAYVPVIFATPMRVSNSFPASGPWRITIVMFRSPGYIHDYLNSQNPATYLAEWSKNRGLAGGYMMDSRPPTMSSETFNFRGEAYLVDSVQQPSPTAGTDKVCLAAGFTAGTPNINTLIFSGGANLATWVSLPHAVTVYHTIIGD